MATNRKLLNPTQTVALLNNPEFIADSRIYWDQYRAHSERIGADRREWDRHAPAFMSTFLDPFAQKWMGAYPASDELLSSPLRQETNAAQLTGRWGLIPAYPWTTGKDVTNHLKQLQKTIGKKHLDVDAIRKAQIARWLEVNFISIQTGMAPKRPALAKAVWGRRKGLERPSKEGAIGKLSEERENALMKHYLTKGKTYAQAERLVYKSARGNESAAAAMVRMALQRQRAKQVDLKKVMTDLKKTDTLGLAVTMLLRELPTSKSSPRNLEAICARAVELGNTLLPPESPVKNAN